MGTLERQMSEGVAWNQGELSEETRRMVLEQAMQTNHTMAIFGLMDDILAVSKNPHASIIRRLRAMKNDLSLNDPMPLHDVTTLDLAIKALEAHS
jgi:hypothetical protein